MLGIHELWLFVLSGLLLNITPGPDTAYILGRSIQLGWRGGAAAVFGICCGCLVHVFAAAIGLSALLDGVIDGVCDPEAGRRGLPAVHRCTDAAVALGRRSPMWRCRAVRRRWPRCSGRARSPTCSIRKWRCSSSPSCRNSSTSTSEHKTLAFLLLGAIFIFNGMLWCLAIAAFAAKAASRIRQSEGLIGWINRALGGLFIYLGIRVAMLETR